MKRYAVWLTALLMAVAVVWLVLPKPAQVAPSARLLEVAEGLDDISLSVRLNEKDRSLSVIQTLHLQNRTGQEQDAAVLRTWANAFQTLDTSPCAAEEALYSQYYPNGFSSGAVVMAQAQANGQQVLHRYTDDARTVLKVPVPGGWQAGETVELKLVYTIHLPQMANRFGVWQDIWAIGNAFAIPAVWENGAFRTDPYASVGDPFVSDCANYTVTVTVPKGYVCAGSAHPLVKADGENLVYTFDAPAVRDFALTVSPNYQKAQKLTNGVLVTAYARTKAQARQLLRDGQKALALYSELFGSYLYPSYTLAQVHFPMGGMEYPGMSMLSSALCEEGGRELEYAVAHETAHQWWYAVVGSDSWNQAWQDEALCEYSLLLYAQERYGMAERNDLEQSRMESALRVTVPPGVSPGAPLDYFASMSEYKLLVYDRGAACLCAIDRTVSLDRFLRDYYGAYAFSRAARADFEQQLFASTGEDMIPLMRDYLDTSIVN